MGKRGFLALCVINLALLVMYIVADEYQWGLLRGLDLVIKGVYWDPIRIQIPLVAHPGDPRLINATMWINNFSFMIVLAIVVIDLVAVWRIARGAH